MNESKEIVVPYKAPASLIRHVGFFMCLLIMEPYDDCIMSESSKIEALHI